MPSWHRSFTPWQGHDEPLREDNVYLGFRCPSYTITIQAGCQVTISLAPYPTVLQAMAVYEGCFTRLCNALAANNCMPAP